MSIPVFLIKSLIVFALVCWVKYREYTGKDFYITKEDLQVAIRFSIENPGLDNYFMLFEDTNDKLSSAVYSNIVEVIDKIVMGINNFEEENNQTNNI